MPILFRFVQNVKNMDFCIGTPCYWLIGFGLMFGFNGGSSLSLSTDETMTLSCACGQHPPAEDQGRGHGLQDLGRFRGGGRRDGVDILFSFFLFSDNSKHSSKPRSFTQRSGALAFLDSACPSCYLCGQDIKNTGVLS
ncbi:hypothetical protein C4N26_03325 [Faecalibacterium prausnitzii]|uniref:Uncharacterized protein n=1 Tax=Faecalibacterium prausnitzii TaxID=853 RepID=A0A329U133_9FIRM|nr:hypothetical protein C4N26_03325 [Faecalibacterium prausnitzii]